MRELSHRREVQLLSEMLGTYLLVLLGPGSIVVSSLLGLPSIETLILAAVVFGSTVAAVILTLGRYSGAHINPAITVGSALSGEFNPRLLLPYVSFQIVGGLLAGLSLRLALGRLGPVASLGSTKLAMGVTPVEGAALEICGTFILTFTALVASSYVKAPFKQSLLVGGTILLLILLIGPLTGASLNPARSLGPSVFSGYLQDQSVYYVGPFLGAASAGLAFRETRRHVGKKGDSILFVCVENAGRSQMAEAFALKRGLKASSAGTVPASKVNPTVVEVMREKGLDVSGNLPKMLTTDMINRADLVVTMGCSVEEVCPRPMLAKMQKKLVDWKLEDPKGKPIEEVRRIRDEIESRVKALDGPNRSTGAA